MKDAAFLDGIFSNIVLLRNKTNFLFDPWDTITTESFGARSFCSAGGIRLR